MSAPRINPEEISEALFVDYEGNMQRAPTLLGWRLNGSHHAAIVEPEFGTCENRWRARDIFVRPHRQLVRELVTRACDEKRLIISWSEHDLRCMLQALSPRDQSLLISRYRNAIKTARSWHYHHEQKRAPAGDLAYFCQLLGYPVPPKYGTGHVGQALRLIRSQVLEGREYPELTRRARASWVVAVRHNAHDLQAMEYVLHAMLGVTMHKRLPAQMALTLVQST
jgi:hypothetical protein